TIADDLGLFLSKRRLEAEHKSFADIVERIDDPVMLQNRDGTFRVINEATADFAGMEPDELKGTDEAAFMDANAAETVRRMKQTVLEVEEPASYQVTPAFPDGRERTFSTTRYPYYDDGGRLDGTIAICRDVTDLKEHQRHLQILDRVLRHNVNNNMNAVQGYARLIREETSGEVRQYAERIASNSETLLDIAEKQRKITDFLSKPRKKEVIDLANVVDRLRDRIQWKYPGAQLSTFCPEEASVVASNTIELAIEELITNGIVHADSDEPTVSLEVTPDGETVEIAIVDENEAIPEMDRAVLLGNVELTALDHGSGLGLWLIKLVVDHSDGTLSFEENEPRGNVVRIELSAR
ncbi:MAG: PAS domain-containing sensor histidine kinase, partial [Haloferacaceae archaeon]